MGEEDCPGGLAVEELVEREVAGRGLAREVGEGGADLDLEVLRAGHRHRRLRRGRLLSGLARAVYVAQVRLSRGQLLHLEVAELLLGLLGRDGWGDDDALLGFPVARRRHLEVLREEQRLHDAHDLQEVTTGGCWVEDRGAVGLVRADEEQRAGGHGDARGVFLARVEHAQHRRDLPPLVRNQGEAQVVAISRLSSAIKGKPRSSPPIPRASSIFSSTEVRRPSWRCLRASTSFDHSVCSETASQLRPMSLMPILANLPARLLQMASSVVQTGVKSFGCEKRIVQAGVPSLPRNSWNLNFPCVVSQSKSGKAAPILMRKLSGFCSAGTWSFPRIVGGDCESFCSGADALLPLQPMALT
mmetsp:Transcript_6001/g.19220  ORF Transcript_6001/g.19220 Transcript_6001/m.19220 type:complete len:358 (+) Transcript_6001:1188-2261(+)